MLCSTVNRGRKELSKVPWVWHWKSQPSGWWWILSQPWRLGPTKGTKEAVNCSLGPPCQHPITLLYSTTCWFSTQVYVLSSYQMWLLSCRASLKVNRKVIGYSSDMHGAIAPVAILCRASLYCSCQGSAKVDSDFSPSAVWIAPSRIMKASQWVWIAKVSFSLISPCLMIQVCSVFSTRVLPSSSGG